MKIIKPSFEILDCPDGNSILKKIEKIGRICYKSEDRITETSATPFIKTLLSLQHESVLEHQNITVIITCDRGVSHELVRHRIASYTQASTRYCNYSNDKFGNEITVIKPLFWEETDPSYSLWKSANEYLERVYMEMLQNKCKPEEARSILPNSLATEIVITTNLRQWRHILKLRTSNKAHSQMREVMIPLLNELKKLVPVIFNLI